MNWLKEPLLHFVFIGLALFALYAWLNPDELAGDDSIVVTPGQVETLAANFSRTWNRPPTAEELKHLVDSFVVEEIYYRQALELGLDRDDPVVRRRMRQKMEFMTADVSEALQPQEQALRQYLQDNPDAFRQDPVFSFQQVYFPYDTDAGELEALKTRLEQGESVETVQTLLPSSMEDASAFSVNRNFGEGFADKLTRLPLEQWSGPLESGFGLHLVRVTHFTPGYLPELPEVRGEVEREWRVQQNRLLKERMLDALLADYDITIQWPSDAPSDMRTDKDGGSSS